MERDDETICLLACALVALVASTAFAADDAKITVEKVIDTDKTVIGQPIVMPKDPTLVATVADLPAGIAPARAQASLSALRLHAGGRTHRHQ